MLMGRRQEENAEHCSCAKSEGQPKRPSVGVGPVLQEPAQNRPDGHPDAGPGHLPPVGGPGGGIAVVLPVYDWESRHLTAHSDSEQHGKDEVGR